MNKSQNQSRALVYVLSAVGLLWALFQLLLPRVLIIDSISVRAIHMLFACVMALLIGRTIKQRDGSFKVANTRALIILHVVLVAVIVGCVLYLIIGQESIAGRAGVPLPSDVVISLVLIAILLYATCLQVGIWLPLIAVVFSIVVFISEFLPALLAFRAANLAKYVNQMALSTEGIFGVPLDVSANTVFLFVLLGSLLNSCGASVFFNDVASSLFGRFKGGPAKTAVVASGFTGLVSGSSIANVVTTGTFTIPLMKKVGYPGKIAAATEVAASTNGQLMPPIMGAAAFIMAEYLGIAYLSVIKAAIVPAVVSYVALFYITHLEALRNNLRGLTAAETPRFWDTIKKHYYHLVPIVVLIGDLVVLRRTPKFAAFDAIVALVVVMAIKALVVKSGDLSAWDSLKMLFRQLIAGTIDGSKNMLIVALATATAGIVVGTVNMGIGSRIVHIVEIVSGGNIFVLLFITAVASLVLGMGLPTTATYIVMASITVPIIVQISGSIGVIIPAIAAHLFCFYFGILADDTPPVGLAAYAASAIADSSPIETGIKGFIYDLRTAIIPFAFIFNSDILLIGITNIWHAALIFCATAVGSLAFTNAVQHWGMIKNRAHETVLFLMVTVLMFVPNHVARWLSLDYEVRYYAYAIGVLLYATVFLLQMPRYKKKQAVA